MKAFGQKPGHFPLQEHSVAIPSTPSEKLHPDSESATNQTKLKKPKSLEEWVDGMGEAFRRNAINLDSMSREEK